MTNGRTYIHRWFGVVVALGAAAAAGAAAPEVFSVHDLNRDGYIDRPEYERMRADCLARRSERGHRPCAIEFSAMDADGDDRIAEQELVAALERWPGRYRRRGGAQSPPAAPDPGGETSR